MSKKAIDKVDKEYVKARAAIKQLLVKRRSLVEAYVKDLPPREAFDMRLDHLMLEHPKWSSEGREEDGDDEGGFKIFIEECEEKETLDWLEDPRYNFSSSIAHHKVYTNELTTYKILTTLDVTFYDEDVDEDDEEGEEEEKEEEVQQKHDKKRLKRK